MSSTKSTLFANMAKKTKIGQLSATQLAEVELMLVHISKVTIRAIIEEALFKTIL